MPEAAEHIQLASRETCVVLPAILCAAPGVGEQIERTARIALETALPRSRAALMTLKPSGEPEETLRRLLEMRGRLRSREWLAQFPPPDLRVEGLQEGDARLLLTLVIAPGEDAPEITPEIQTLLQVLEDPGNDGNPQGRFGGHGAITISLLLLTDTDRLRERERLAALETEVIMPLFERMKRLRDRGYHDVNLYWLDTRRLRGGVRVSWRYLEDIAGLSLALSIVSAEFRPLVVEKEPFQEKKNGRLYALGAAAAGLNPETLRPRLALIFLRDALAALKIDGDSAPDEMILKHPEVTLLGESEFFNHLARDLDLHLQARPGGRRIQLNLFDVEESFQFLDLPWRQWAFRLDAYDAFLRGVRAPEYTRRLEQNASLALEGAFEAMRGDISGWIATRRDGVWKAGAALEEIRRRLEHLAAVAGQTLQGSVDRTMAARENLVRAMESRQDVAALGIRLVFFLAISVYLILGLHETWIPLGLASRLLLAGAAGALAVSFLFRHTRAERNLSESANEYRNAIEAKYNAALLKRLCEIATQVIASLRDSAESNAAQVDRFRSCLREAPARLEEQFETPLASEESPMRSLAAKPEEIRCVYEISRLDAKALCHRILETRALEEWRSMESGRLIATLLPIAEAMMLDSPNRADLSAYIGKRSLDIQTLYRTLLEDSQPCLFFDEPAFHREVAVFYPIGVEAPRRSDNEALSAEFQKAAETPWNLVFAAQRSYPLYYSEHVRPQLF